MTLGALYQWGCGYLEDHQVAGANTDAWILMAHVFKINRVTYLLNQEEMAPEQETSEYEALICRRATHEPVQYIIGTAPFMGLDFMVNDKVLIPRLDTEVLVETILKKVPHQGRVLDMCTGSGCILLSLAALGHVDYGLGVDISAEALEVARANQEKLQVHRVEFGQSNLFENIQGCFDVIVSNPPYISSEEVDRLMPEVLEHEPRLALDGSADGLFFYKKIIREAGNYLSEAGMLFFEIGWDQGMSVKALMEASGFINVTVKKDLAGLDRVVYGEITKR